MNAEVVHDQSNQFYVGIILISDFLDELSPINLTLPVTEKCEAFCKMQ